MDRAVPPSPIASSRGWCNLSRVLRKVEEEVEGGGGEQRACESKHGEKFRREYIKQLLVGSFSRGEERPRWESNREETGAFICDMKQPVDLSTLLLQLPWV